MWIELSAQEPQREQVYLVFSPEYGYQTAMWDNKPSVRYGWDAVTHWMAFEFLPKGERKP